MRKEISNWAALVCGLLFFISCSDSTTVGSGLLQDEDLVVEFKDDFELIAKSILTGPTVTYTSSNNPIRSHLVGELNDPVFGRSIASTYFQMVYYNLFYPNYDGATIDSLVLMLEIDPNLTYGNTLGSYDFELFRLTEDITDLDTIYSNSNFDFDPEPIGVLKGFNPSLQDTIRVPDPIEDTLEYVNVIRIPLSHAFAEELFQIEVPSTEENASLLNSFNGFYLKATTENSAMMALDLSASSNNSIVTMYYSRDSVPTKFDYLLGNDRPLRFEHDYTGTDIPNVLNKKITGDEVLYLQGMEGIDVEIDLSDILSLEQDILINHAEIEFTVATELLGDTILYPSLSAIGLYKYNSSGKIQGIRDLEIAETSGSINFLFGGQKENTAENVTLTTHTMNLTSHVKDVLKGKESTNLLVSALNKAENPGRTILFGPEHSTYPIKLRITYTNP